MVEGFRVRVERGSRLVKGRGEDVRWEPVMTDGICELSFSSRAAGWQGSTSDDQAREYRKYGVRGANAAQDGRAAT